MIYFNYRQIATATLYHLLIYDDWLLKFNDCYCVVFQITHNCLHYTIHSCILLFATILLLHLLFVFAKYIEYV